MKRRLLNLLTSLSLLLCAVACVLWLRSQFANDRLNYTSPSDTGDQPMYRQYFARSGKGGFAFWVWGRDKPRAADYRLSGSREPAYWYPIQARPGESRYTAWSRAGFEWLSNDRSLMVTAPYWPVVLLSAVLPTLAAVRLMRRRRRPPPGHCPRCGYDLRATPDQCPECGASIRRG